jgi:hypothetical protein
MIRRMNLLRASQLFTRSRQISTVTLARSSINIRARSARDHSLPISFWTRLNGSLPSSNISPFLHQTTGVGMGLIYLCTTATTNDLNRNIHTLAQTEQNHNNFINNNNNNENKNINNTHKHKHKHQHTHSQNRSNIAIQDARALSSDAVRDTEKGVILEYTKLEESEARAVFRECDCVCFDVDSTVTQEEGIDVLADALGKVYMLNKHSCPLSLVSGPPFSCSFRLSITSSSSTTSVLYIPAYYNITVFLINI